MIIIRPTGIETELLCPASKRYLSRLLVGTSGINPDLTWSGLRSTNRSYKNSLRIPFSGDHCGGVTPDPIPNSEVKPSRADGTAWATVWESRSLPEIFHP